MKRFAFRLQRILDLRRATEEQILAQFGREQMRLRDEQLRLTLFRDEQETQMTEVATDRQEPFTVWSQAATCRYLQRVSRVIEFQSGRVAQQCGQVDAARGVYLRARQDTTILERLREKRHADWLKDELRDEGKILDEIGSPPRDREEQPL